MVDVAYQSVSEEKINVFDQLRINTFQSHARLFNRPLLFKLQKGTWQVYVGLWKRLLCFVIRSTRPDQPIALAHILTHDQQENIDAPLKFARASLQSDQADQQLEAATERPCLLLCISLLDHRLRGSLFESVALGYLAVSRPSEI